MFSLLSPEAFLPVVSSQDPLTSYLYLFVSAALSKSSWSKYNSAWRKYEKFCALYNFQISWPISIKTVRAFVIWLLAVEKLKPETVKSYLSGLAMASTLANGEKVNFLADKIVNLCITGAGNSEIYTQCRQNSRRSLSLDALKVLGHRIAISNWSLDSKIVIWAACTVAFFSCARMGELLPKSNKNIDFLTTLCWKNVKFYESGEILFFLPTTKTSKTKGCFIDIFPFIVKSCCPSKAMFDLLACSNHAKNPDSPVFRFASGKFLTTAHLNSILKELMSDIFIPGKDDISCHSFRSAIPTIIANYPGNSDISDIKEWGHWSSDSYKIYTKLEKEKRRALFEKLSKIIVLSNSKF